MLAEDREMIVVTLEDLAEDIDEICRLARKFDGEVVLCLQRGDGQHRSNEENNMTEVFITKPAGEKTGEKPAFAEQQGFTMVELMIAVTLISVVLLAVGALSSLTANGIALVQRKRAAEKYAAEISSRLKADQKTMIPEGGAFPVNAATGDPVRMGDGRVKLTCSEMYCDRIISIPSETEGAGATEQVISWGGQVPEGASVRFIRAWTLSDEDAQRNWRRITVAVFPTDSRVPTSYSVTGGVIK